MTAAKLSRCFIPVATIIAATLLTGCTLGPDYQRPELPTPPQYRFEEGTAAAESIADTPWWDVFQDPVLQDLIREAIAANLDLRAAVARVDAARARAGIARSFLYPQVGVAAGATGEEVSQLTDPDLNLNDTTYSNYGIGFQASWELDLFGRIRRKNEAALAEVLATEAGQRGVLVTLVAEVASGYFQLLELDYELEIAHRTLQLNDETIEFYTDRLEGGVSNLLELNQAVANRAVTASAIPDLELQIAVAENNVSLLLGRVPGPIKRGAALIDLPDYSPAVPAGLPAALLERRPDVIRAEQLLVAANADIGAARALFYPTINLTGFLGTASGDLEDIANPDAALWSITAGLFQPLFQGGRIRRNYERTEALFQEALAQYQKAALNAYREVANSLVAIEKLTTARSEREKGVAALAEASDLSRERYDTGLSNYLEILIADQQLFIQERQLARTRGAQLVALVDLYRALGGGWQADDTEATNTP
jgi:multidrug efflux system outer membrane protein